MKLFRYDSSDLTYKLIKNRSLLLIMLSVLSIIVISFIIGYYSNSSKHTAGCNDFSHERAQRYLENLDLHPEDITAWEDSVFLDYKVRADLWLSRKKFQGTPLSGDILTLAARNAYDSTGIILPVELALTQAQLESSMGRSGKSPENNPFNIGEHDSGTVKWFESTFEGTQAYYYYMCNNYLRCRDIDDLFANFVNCGGKRYASSPTYEQHVRDQYYAIKAWLENNMKD